MIEHLLVGVAVSIIWAMVNVAQPRLRRHGSPIGTDLDSCWGGLPGFASVRAKIWSKRNSIERFHDAGERFSERAKEEL